MKFELLACNVGTNVIYNAPLTRMAGVTNDVAVFTNSLARVIIPDTNLLDSYLDTNVQGGPLDAHIGVPALGAANVLFALNETSANSGKFINQYTALSVSFTNQLRDNAVDRLTNVVWHLGGCSETNTLTETGVNTLTFTNGGITLHWPAGPPWTTTNAESATVTFTDTNAAVLNLSLDLWETDTNSLVFETFDEYLSPDDDYGLYFGFNYSAGSGTVTAASEVQDLHLYFARFQGPQSVLAWMAGQSNGKIVQGPDGQYYMANGDQKPAAILGLDADPTGPIGADCTGTALGGAVKGVTGGVKALVIGVWDLSKQVVPGEQLALDYFSSSSNEEFLQIWQQRFKKANPVTQRLVSYTLGQLGSPDGDFATFAKGFMDTAAGATSDQFKKFTHGTQMALSGIASVLKKTSDELGNGCPERRGEIIGRLSFEAITLLQPEIKFAELGEVARLEAAGAKMLEAAEETSQVVKEVPEVAAIVEKAKARAEIINQVESSFTGRLQSGAELRGTVFGIEKLESMNWEVAGKLTYGGNNGIDMWLKGVGPNEGRWAVVECKGGASQTTLSCLKADTQGMRQMTKDWVRDRLQQSLQNGNANAQELLEALGQGKLDFYVTLEKGGAGASGEVWKINPAIYDVGKASATKRVGAATRVYP